MIEIDLGLFTKVERGTHIGRVKVTRGGKTFWREQRVGVKPSRKDTGKIASLPEDMKKEILELRRLGDSGAKIKESIEESIEHETESITLSSSDRQRVDDIDNQIMNITQNLRSEYNPIRIKDLKIKRDKLLKEGRELAPTKEVTYIHGKSTNRNFVEEGLIDKNGKLMITGQSLVDWAKARGVESTKKRKTVKAVEEKAKEIEEKRFKEANEKLARLQTENKMLQEQLDRERKSKMESDAIRDKLRNENYILREKLKLIKVNKSVSGEKVIEINLSKVERGLREEKVKVVRGGKTFYRRQRVGQKEKEKGVDLASQLKVGDKIKFMGEEKEVTHIFDVTGSFELDNTLSYSPKEINKYGESIKGEPKKPPVIMGLNKPEIEEEKEEPEKPKIEEKAEPKFEEKSKIVGSSKDGSLSANDRKQATKNMEKFIGELEDEERGKNIAGDDSVRKAGNYYTKGNAIDFNTYLIADKKEIMDFETYGLRNIKGEEKAEVDKKIKILDEFLDRAPKVKGVSYRAMWWDPNDSVQKKRFDDFISDLKPGNVVESKPYSSTTTSEKMMKDFTKMAKGGDITAHVEYESNGVYLNGESKSPEQQEVLIGHGVKFEVDSVEFSKNKKHVNIKFREVGLNE